MRSPERLRAHYEVETRLADRLRGASREDRKLLYRTVYDELFQTVQDHPQLTRPADPVAEQRAVGRQVQVLERFVRPGGTFLEVGPGDCQVSFAISATARMVWAIDVSEEVVGRAVRPGNFSLVLSDGTDIPIPAGSVDVAYSNQLMEHLHPDDAREQLKNIFQVLTPGGVYLCTTPPRLTGPHDISAHYDVVARGLHLKEYTVSELRQLFFASGFVRVQVVLRVGGLVLVLPSTPFAWLEALLERLPTRPTRAVLRRTPLGRLLPSRFIACRGGSSPSPSGGPPDRYCGAEGDPRVKARIWRVRVDTLRRKRQGASLW